MAEKKQKYLLTTTQDEYRIYKGLSKLNSKKIIQFFKQAKDLNSLPKKIYGWHIKRFSTSLFTEEVQIKTTYQNN